MQPRDANTQHCRHGGRVLILEPWWIRRFVAVSDSVSQPHVGTESRSPWLRPNSAAFFFSGPASSSVGGLWLSRAWRSSLLFRALSRPAVLTLSKEPQLRRESTSLGALDNLYNLGSAGRGASKFMGQIHWTRERAARKNRREGVHICMPALTGVAICTEMRPLARCVTVTAGLCYHTILARLGFGSYANGSDGHLRDT